METLQRAFGGKTYQAVESCAPVNLVRVTIQKTPKIENTPLASESTIIFIKHPICERKDTSSMVNLP